MFCDVFERADILIFSLKMSAVFYGLFSISFIFEWLRKKKRREAEMSADSLTF